jgi:signal transduction histidine kinase
MDHAEREETIACDVLSLDRSAELETILAAWHAATCRLEQTHEALRAEVCRLTDELEIKNRALARKNRLADLGQMAAHVAHEVRNSLVPVTLYLGLLRRRILTDPAALEILGKIESGFVALDATVNDLLGFASDRDPQRQPLSAVGLVAEVLASVAPQLAAQRIQAAVEGSEETVATADRDMLRRAVLNLVLNAMDAMPDGGRLTVAVRPEDGAVTLSVADTGPGLSEEVRQRACEPFFTTKRTGTGLGLAIVQRIAEAHSGRVTCGNRLPRGAVFTICIPEAQEFAA